MSKIRKPVYKTCPFCGRFPSGWKTLNAINQSRWKVGCMNNDCQMEPQTKAYESIGEARLIWNTRIENAYARKVNQ